MRELFLVLFIFPIVVYGAETKRTVHIEGMTCPSCASSVEKQFKGLSQVAGVSINIRKGTAIVSVKDGKSLSDNEIKEAIDQAGYKVTTFLDSK